MGNHSAHKPSKFRNYSIMYANLTPKPLAIKPLFVTIGLPTVFENRPVMRAMVVVGKIHCHFGTVPQESN